MTITWHEFKMPIPDVWLIRNLISGATCRLLRTHQVTDFNRDLSVFRFGQYERRFHELRRPSRALSWFRLLCDHWSLGRKCFREHDGSTCTHAFSGRTYEWAIIRNWRRTIYRRELTRYLRYLLFPPFIRNRDPTILRKRDTWNLYVTACHNLSTFMSRIWSCAITSSKNRISLYRPVTLGEV